MHLSLFSDAYLSDALDDAGAGGSPFAPSCAHRDVMFRGVAAIGIAGTLVALLFLSNAVRSDETNGAEAKVAVQMFQVKMSDRIAPVR